MARAQRSPNAATHAISFPPVDSVSRIKISVSNSDGAKARLEDEHAREYPNQHDGEHRSKDLGPLHAVAVLRARRLISQPQGEERNEERGTRPRRSACAPRRS